MHRSHSPVNTLLVVVALLAMAGGMVVVIVTSPQSWQYGPGTWIQAMITKPTPFLPTAAAPTASPTNPSSSAASSPTARPTSHAVTSTPDFTATALALDTATPEITPSDTPAALPPDVTALAVVTVQGVGSARVRNQPGGDTVVAAVPSGTQVQVLGGRVEFNNVVWLQVRLPGGQVGWIADFLLRITQTF